MAKKKSKARKIVKRIFISILALIGLAWGISFWNFISKRVESDIAFYILTGIMILLSLLGIIIFHTKFGFKKLREKIN